MTDYGQVYVEALARVQAYIDSSDLNNFCKLLANCVRIFTLGKGRTGLVMDMFAMRLVHLGKQAHPIGKPATPRVAEGDLVVLASGSGTTPALLHIADQSNEIGADLAVICGTPGSPLSAKTSHTLILPAQDAIPPGFTESKVLSGTLFEQTLLITLDSVIGTVMESAGQSFDDLSGRHANLE